MKTRHLITLATVSFAATCLYADDETKPFKGKAQIIPGLIEAEHYDEGPSGKAYHDVDKQNRGVDYRGKTQVDIEKRPDASNGHGVGWVRASEWQVYTVMIKESGTYRIEIPVASKKEGGLFHIEIDGKDVTGPIRLPDTGAWNKLKVITAKTTELEKGSRQMKVVMDKDGASGGIGDIDYYKFVKTD